ncbi:MAG TPA: hypothetical protein VIH93_11525 [Thermoanaerobaculia bacterium]|jgi:hypothetical protein
MVPELRRAYNAAFTEEKYRRLLASLERAAGFPVDFRISETPIFLDAASAGRLVEAAAEVLAAVSTPAYLAAAERAVPAGLSVPGPLGQPLFIQIDFALTRDEGGGLLPQLIELQGFPSLYGFQWLLDREARRAFPGAVPEGWATYFGGLDAAGYVERLREVIVGPEDPETVVLLEIDPDRQKTRIDFTMTGHLLGIAAVDPREVREQGGRLVYKKGDIEIPIRRLYNRVIFDEVARRGLDLDHLFRRDLAELGVAWIGHPNWFFRISKYSLPFVESRYAPKAYFVSDLATYPADLDRYVLKPLYSFAGLGVELAPTPERLRSLAHPEQFILQRMVDYAPFVETPDVPAKAEVRMMFLWDERSERPALVNSLVRMSKGSMMGVDFNKDKTWIGASLAYHPPVG